MSAQCTFLCFFYTVKHVLVNTLTFCLCFDVALLPPFCSYTPNHCNTQLHCVIPTNLQTNNYLDCLRYLYRIPNNPHNVSLTQWESKCINISHIQYLTRLALLSVPSQADQSAAGTTERRRGDIVGHCGGLDGRHEDAALQGGLLWGVLQLMWHHAQDLHRVRCTDTHGRHQNTPPPFPWCTYVPLSPGV